MALEHDLDYASFGEVLTEVKDVAVFDLARYVVRLPKRYRDILQPAPVGVYARGVLEPILTFSEKTRYFTSKQYKTAPKFPDVLNFEQFATSKQAIVDKDGKVIHVCPAMVKDLFSTECSFEYSAVHLVGIATWDTMRRLHRHTSPTSTLQKRQLCPDNYVTDGALEHIDYEDQPGITKLVDRLLDFVGRDIHHQYHLALKNTTLTVEKGNDYRVIEYYRERFSSLEESELFKQVTGTYR